MHHVYAHPEHLIHWDQIHWDEWLSMVTSAAILAVLVVGGFSGTDIALLSDVNLAP